MMREHVLTEYKEVHNNKTGRTNYWFHRKHVSGLNGFSRGFRKITPASYVRIHERLTALECYGEVVQSRFDMPWRGVTVTTWTFTDLYFARKQEGG